MMSKTKREQAKARAEAAREAHTRQQTRADNINWDETLVSEAVTEYAVVHGFEIVVAGIAGLYGVADGCVYPLDTRLGVRIVGHDDFHFAGSVEPPGVFA